MIFMTSENQKSGIPPDKDALAIDLLIKRTAEGSADAFEELYRRLSPAVYAYALSTLRNRADAEDVLQNCFLALYRSAGGYTPDGRGRSYVMTIAHNLCMMQLRKRRNEAPSGEEPTLFSEDESSLSPYHHALLKECLTSLGDEEPYPARRIRHQAPGDRRYARPAAPDRPFKIPSGSPQAAKEIRKRRMIKCQRKT